MIGSEERGNVVVCRPVAVVAPLPLRETEFRPAVGVEWYSELLIQHLRRRGLRVVAVAQQADGEKRCREEDGFVVVRSWRRGGLFSFGIVGSILGFGSRLAHLQHEFFLFGNWLTALEFPLILLVLRVVRIPTIVTLHGVVPLSAINRRFAREQGTWLPPRFVAIGFRALTGTIVGLSRVVIVHEGAHREVLLGEYGCKGKKIRVVPLGIESKALGMSRAQAKLKLGMCGKKVVLVFGYLTWYKGVLELMASFRGVAERRPEAVLIIAGGEHPRHRGRREYERFLSALRSQVEKSRGRIAMTGYVPEAMVEVYFLAADVAVFPHTVSLSASGPMAIAVSYGTPFIASEVFREVVRDDRLIFAHSSTSLARCLEYALGDPEFGRRARGVIERLRRERRWEIVAARTAGIYSELLEE